ncbi:plant expansin, partial [Russula vinacea]
LGACGIENSNSDFIVAVPPEVFDHFPGYDGANPNTNPICGKKITAQCNVTVSVTDRCGGCATGTSLDFTPSAFSQLADQSVGRLFDMTWTWA